MQGKIIKAENGKFTIYYDNKLINAIARGKLKVGGVYVGDNVNFDYLPNGMGDYVIEGVENRKNILKRPVISNIDNCIIDKIIINCLINNIVPFICLNKSDLITDSEIEVIRNEYGGVVSDVIITNALIESDEGIKNLYKILASGTVNIMAGQSAVGKSSILNAIIGKNVAKIGELSQKNEHGMHTTRTSQMYLLENSAMLADTPGFSLLELNKDLRPENIRLYYADFEKSAANCRFRTCTHTVESDCAVLDAVKNGVINSNRYERYKKLYLEKKENWENRW